MDGVGITVKVIPLLALQLVAVPTRVPLNDTVLLLCVAPIGSSVPSEALQRSECSISVLPDNGVLRLRAEFSDIPDGRIDSNDGFGHRALDSPPLRSARIWDLHYVAG